MKRTNAHIMLNDGLDCPKAWDRAAEVFTRQEAIEKVWQDATASIGPALPRPCLCVGIEPVPQRPNRARTFSHVSFGPNLYADEWYFGALSTQFPNAVWRLSNGILGKRNPFVLVEGETVRAILMPMDNGDGETVPLEVYTRGVQPSAVFLRGQDGVTFSPAQDTKNALARACNNSDYTKAQKAMGFDKAKAALQDWRNLPLTKLNTAVQGLRYAYGTTATNGPSVFPWNPDTL